jgi:hypothetical protein
MNSRRPRVATDVQHVQPLNRLRRASLMSILP